MKHGFARFIVPVESISVQFRSLRRRPAADHLSIGSINTMRFLASLSTVFLLIAVTGCSDRVSYSYASYGNSDKLMVEGTLSLPRLTADMGNISGTWKTKAVGNSEFSNGSDDIDNQTGNGELRGQVNNGVVKFEFHPVDSADSGFYLSGELTPEGFSGTWSFDCEAGEYLNRGRFVATAN